MFMLANLARVLQTTFGESAEEANELCHAVKRRRRFTPVTLAQSFILGLLAKPKAKSEDISAMASALGVTVSPQAVEQRYSQELCNFFQTLFPKLVNVVVHADEALAPILDRFSEVKVIDSSSIQLPASLAQQFPGCGGSGSSGTAALKLQTELDLRTGQLLHLQVEPGKSPDHATDRQQVVPRANSLRIADLGYFSIPVLRLIELAQAFFLTRIQHVNKIIVEGKEFVIVEWLNGQELQVVDQQILLGSKHRLACRLIAWRVPAEIANRRRAKLRANTKAKTGRQPTQASLNACDWEFLVTNLPEEQLSVREAIVLYRSRWQIELLFKRWKSICCIDLLDGRDDIMTMTRFWARLCGAVVQHWLIVVVGWSATSTLSFAKVGKLIGKTVSELASSLHSESAIQAVIEKLQRQAHVTCQRNKRRKHPGTLELLRNAALLEYSLT